MNNKKRLMKSTPNRIIRLVVSLLMLQVLFYKVPLAAKAPVAATEAKEGTTTPDVEATVQEEEAKVAQGEETPAEAAENIEEAEKEEEEGGEKEIEPLKVGNLALRSSQMPGIAFAFGQNFLDKGTFQIYEFAERTRGICESFTDVTTWFLYEPTDTLSVLLAIPVVAKFQIEDCRSSGIEDMYVQFEYADFSQSTLTAYNYSTVVAALYMPTGSTEKNPSLGFGGPSVFVGATAAHLGIDWYVFADLGYFAHTCREGTKFGNTVFYDWGIGHNLCHLNGKIVFALLEFNGEHFKRDTIEGIVDCNSGGDILYAGPSFWFSTEHFILQVGVEFPIMQRLNGIQNEITSRSIFTLSWTF